MVGDGTVTWASVFELAYWGLAIFLIGVCSHLLGVIALHRLSVSRKGSHAGGAWGEYGETITEGCSLKLIGALLTTGLALLALGLLVL